MRIALAGAPFRNKDIDFNLASIRRYLSEAAVQRAQLVCFGEAFLQGFDAFCWEYQKDLQVAVSTDDAVFRSLCEETEVSGVDLLFGFLERDGDTLYSSCALLGSGKLLHLYRRVSIGWKEYTRTDDHYAEGAQVLPFEYRGKKCLIALCGDLWDVTASQFIQDIDLLFWPLYINFSREAWYGSDNERQNYADKAAEYNCDVLMINCMDDQSSENDPALGGCYHYRSGQIKAEWPLGSEGMLIVDI